MGVRVQRCTAAIHGNKGLSDAVQALKCFFFFFFFLMFLTDGDVCFLPHNITLLIDNVLKGWRCDSARLV